MDEKSEKYLKPIRDICQKIEKNANADDQFDELRKLIKRGSFYEYHCFKLLLTLLKTNLKLEAGKVKEIFKIIRTVIDQSSKNKNSILILYYNFIIGLKVNMN